MSGTLFSFALIKNNWPSYGTFALIFTDLLSIAKKNYEILDMENKRMLPSFGTIKSYPIIYVRYLVGNLLPIIFSHIIFDVFQRPFHHRRKFIRKCVNITDMKIITLV